MAPVVTIILMLSCFISCEKAASPVTGQSTVQISLTDGPGAYKEAWIDIEKVMVQVQVSTDTTGAGASGTWVEAPSFQGGRYDLLHYRNGADTAIAAVTVPAGTVSRIQLVLGNDNTLVLDNGKTVTMHAPSTIYCEAKLIIGGDERTPETSYHLVVDFDVARSIHQAGSGDSVDYIFTPYLRAFPKEAGASIEGWVFPGSAHPYVLAIDDLTDTLTAVPDPNGYYKFWGIPSGNYTLQFVPDSASGYERASLTGIMTTQGQVFTADTVMLQP